VISDLIAILNNESHKTCSWTKTH